MSRIFRKVKQKVGKPPGTLIYTGEKKIENIKVRLIDYTKSKLAEKELKKIEEAFPFKDKPTVTWLNIDGLHDISIIEKIGKHFDIHPLVLEDVVNPNQRPKIEDYGDYIFLVLKMVDYSRGNNEITIEQISFR